MPKDILLVFMDDETDEIKEAQRFYNQEDAEAIGKKYVKSGQTARIYREASAYGPKEPSRW